MQAGEFAEAGRDAVPTAGNSPVQRLGLVTQSVGLFSQGDEFGILFHGVHLKKASQENAVLSDRWLMNAAIIC